MSFQKSYSMEKYKDFLVSKDKSKDKICHYATKM